MLLDRLAQLGARLWGGQKRIQEDLGVAPAQRDGLMLADRPFGGRERTRNDEIADGLPFEGSRLLDPPLGGPLQPQVEALAVGRSCLGHRHSQFATDSMYVILVPASRWQAARSPILRVEGVTQTVADEVEAEQRDREEGRGEDQQPRRAFHLGGALGDQDAPGRQRLLDAEAEEREE